VIYVPAGEKNMARSRLFARETKKLIVFTAFLALQAQRYAAMVHRRLEEFGRRIIAD